MSKIVLAIVFILMAGRNYAQQDYFVLIQADNNQPFYARIGGESKTISSSGQGHLILSQLKEGSYNIIIGFPKKLSPEVQFSFTIYKKDLELQLKDLGDKGWGLFNPQTLELKMPDEKKGDESKNHLEGVKKDDAFSRLMAGVVSDTAVMYNTYAMEATLKESPTPPKSTPADTSSPAVLSGTPPVNGKNPNGKPSGIGVDSSAKDMLAATKVPVTMPESPADTANKSIQPILSSPIAKDTSIATVAMNIPARIETLKEKRPVVSLTDSSRSAITGDSSSNHLPAAAKDQQVAGQLPAGSIPPGASPDTASQRAALSAANSSSTDSGAATPGTPPAAAGVGISSAPTGSSVLPNKVGLVVKLSERKTPKGVRLVYADHTKGSKADTIVVIIPVDTMARIAQHPGETNALKTASPRSDTPTLASDRTDHSSAPLDHPTTPQNGSGASPQKTALTPLYRPDTSQKKTPAKSLFINSDCKNFATDYDVDKLRVKMLETAKDEDRILAAHKVFKTRCFTTRQIRALSEVFTSDAQKFRFFETAYPFVSDDHFKELTDLLADPVYNSKFRSMTGQQ